MIFSQRMSFLFSATMSETFKGDHGEGLVSGDKEGKSRGIKHWDVPVSLRVAAVACLFICHLSDWRNLLLPFSWLALQGNSSCSLVWGWITSRTTWWWKGASIWSCKASMAGSLTDVLCLLWLLITSCRLQLTLSFGFEYGSPRCRIREKSHNKNYVPLPCCGLFKLWAR